MGDAQRKLDRGAERVALDIAAIPFHFSRKQVEGVREKEGPDSVGLMALNTFRNLVTAAVNTAFHQGEGRQGGMARQDGRIWAAWQEHLDDDDATVMRVRRDQVDWLAKHVGNEELRLHPAFAGAREVVADYLAGLRDAPAIAENGVVTESSQPAAPAARPGEVATA